MPSPKVEVPHPRRARGAPGAVVALALLTLTAVPVRAQWVDVRVHDPVAIQANGRTWLFATGRGIDVWSSSDLKSWRREPPVFDEAPAWAAELSPRGRGGARNSEWAPDISFHDGTYHLYYAVSSFGTNASAIGHATNGTLDRSDPDFGWVDHGIVVRSVPGRDQWNAIDPNLAFDEEGIPWLAFGSFWSGIKLVKLAPDLNTPAKPEVWHTIAARQRYWKLDERDAGNAMNGAIEAPFIFRKDGWYYLFVSWDACCRGASSTYKIAVGRARSITGPYLDRSGQDMRFGGGTLVARGDSAWAGVGHNAAYTFDGTDYLIFHGYALFDEGRPKLWVTPIAWDEEGWPHVSLH